MAMHVASMANGEPYGLWVTLAYVGHVRGAYFLRRGTLPLQSTDDDLSNRIATVCRPYGKWLAVATQSKYYIRKCLAMAMRTKTRRNRHG